MALGRFWLYHPGPKIEKHSLAWGSQVTPSLNSIKDSNTRAQQQAFVWHLILSHSRICLNTIRNTGEKNLHDRLGVVRPEQHIAGVLFENIEW